MAQLKLDDYESEVLRHLAESFDKGGTWLDFIHFPRYEEVGHERVEQVALRFSNYGLLEPQTTTSFEISPLCVEYVHQLDNPAPRDYPAEIEQTVRSKWWSIPLYIGFVGLPAIVGYIVMLQTALQWFGIIER